MIVTKGAFHKQNPYLLVIAIAAQASAIPSAHLDSLVGNVARIVNYLEEFAHFALSYSGGKTLRLLH